MKLKLFYTHFSVSTPILGVMLTLPMLLLVLILVGLIYQGWRLGHVTEIHQHLCSFARSKVMLMLILIVLLSPPLLNPSHLYACLNVFTSLFLFTGLQLHVTSEFLPTVPFLYVWYNFFILLVTPKIRFVQLQVYISITNLWSVAYSCRDPSAKAVPHHLLSQSHTPSCHILYLQFSDYCSHTGSLYYTE